jgi:hypothetical protein
MTEQDVLRWRWLENGALTTVFGPKGEAVTGEWRKLHKEKHHNFYSSANIIRIIASSRMGWAGHAARMR